MMIHACVVITQNTRCNNHCGLAYFPERDGTIPENTAKLIYGTGRTSKYFSGFDRTLREALCQSDRLFQLH